MSGNGTDPMVTGWPFTFAPFGWVTGGTPAVPEFYWNVVSNEQRWKFLCINLNALVHYANQLGVEIGINKTDIAKLQSDFEYLKDGKFWDFYEQQITNWINANMTAIIERVVKFVYFGLTDDGYFCAYVPDSWSDITFDTGAVYGRSDYGRLILKMRVDSPNAIDNTYSYSLAQSTSLQRLIADLEVNAKRTDSTFDTLYTNLDKTVAAPNGDERQTAKTLARDGENV